MTTREAFMQLLNTRGIYSTIGITKGRVGAMKDLIKNHDKWPTIDKMEELLMKAGVPVLQEKKWGAVGEPGEVVIEKSSFVMKNPIISGPRHYTYKVPDGKPKKKK